MKEIHLLEPQKTIVILTANIGNIRQDSKKCFKTVTVKSEWLRQDGLYSIRYSLFRSNRITR